MPKPTDKKDPTTAPIMDVTAPGKSAPSDTSKPVLITNRPLLKDPMVVSKPEVPVDISTTEEEKNKSASAAPAMASPTEASAEKKITVVDSDKASPVSNPPPAETPTPEKTAAPATEQAAEKSAETTAEPPAPAASPAPAVEATPPTPAAQPDDPTEKAKSDGEGDKPPGDGAEPTEVNEDPDAAAAAAAAKEAEHDQAIQKLADSKQYFLPINSIEKRRSRRFVALGILLSLLLALAWADVALDAGLIHINNVKPLTHFFSN